MANTEMTPNDRPSFFLVIRVLIIIFVANAAILVLQVASVRQLAPFVGCSLDTWTAIIGMFLAGICLGNYYGGKLADRFPRERLLLLLLWVSALCSLSTIGLANLFYRIPFDAGLPLYARIGVISFLICFPSSFVLSLITPLSIRLALGSIQSTGRIVGMIYAFGTLGSLLGNFLTGFVFLAHFNLNHIIFGVVGTLILVSLLALGKMVRASSEIEPVTVEKVPDEVLQEAEDPKAIEIMESNLPHSGKEAPSDMSGNVAWAATIVFLASFFAMSLELVAPRLLAPTLGISLYSFTIIIGTCLAGIALGNIAGGFLADILPRHWVLGSSLLLAGLVTMGIFLGWKYLMEYGTELSQMHMVKCFLLHAGLFFLPLFFLSTVSPQVIRLTLKNVQNAGRISGIIYACSCLGALTGTFATGWWLISLCGVRFLIFSIGVAIFGLAYIAGRGWGSYLSAALYLKIPLITICLVLYFLSDEIESPYLMETNYYSIKVNEMDDHFGRHLHLLQLDSLIHSYVDLDDPEYLGYEHEEVQAEITVLVTGKNPDTNVLVIGGGGYTYPRWVEYKLPEVGIEVVEIDPGVSEVAYEKLGLERDTKIKTWNMDGRQFVTCRAPKKHYALVIQDAVNDLSVPFHLMTKEYNDAVKEILTEDGIFLLSVIDRFKDGQLMRASLRTLKKTFKHVHLIQPDEAWDYEFRDVFVLYGSDRKLDMAELEAAVLEELGVPLKTKMLPAEKLNEYLEEGPQIVLTDQYAPVDNLISILYWEYWKENVD